MRIMPDVVHTFHIGIGVDFCSSTIVLPANKKKFVSPFGDKLSHFLDAAYTSNGAREREREREREALHSV